MTKPISIGFVHFKTLTLEHLDAAWYSVSKQDFTHVNSVYFLDNNTDHSIFDIQNVLNRYPIPVPIFLSHSKHGMSTRTQSWSVNRVCTNTPGPVILFTRSDYILAFSALKTLYEKFQERESQNLKPFISGWCWQMAYDRNASNFDGSIDIDQYNWRELGMSALMQHPYAFRFHETDLDAGVWMTRRDYLAAAGWMNEGMVSWGYQQSTFQRSLRRTGVSCEAVQEYLFAHQHHFAVRDFGLASAEYGAHGGGQ